MGNQTKGKEVRIEKVNQDLMYKGGSQSRQYKMASKPRSNVHSSLVLLCEAGLVTATVKRNRCKHLSPQERNVPILYTVKAYGLSIIIIIFCHQLPYLF